MKYIFILLFCILVLSSCDCWNRHEGHVFDKTTNMPLENVNVSVMFDDTIINNYGLEYDSISISQRELLKDSHGWWDPKDYRRRMIHNIPLFTDSLGFYCIKFMGCDPGTIQLIFLKAGYFPFISKKIKSRNDTLDVKLERMEEYPLSRRYYD